MMKHIAFALLLVLAVCGLGAACAEGWQVTYARSRMAPPVTVEITDPAVTALLEAGLAEALPTEEQPAVNANSRFITLTKGEETVTLFYDEVYHTTWRQEGETWVRLADSLGASLVYPFGLWMWDQPDFEAAAAYADLLAPDGWTPFFVLGRQTLTLPESLTASVTDAADLYFTWAQLFLRDAGYDLTPYLGQEVNVTILGLWDTVERSRFAADDLARGIHLPVNLRCIVLEKDGEVIGAYLSYGRHDGDWKLSLKGRSPADLLGTEDPTDYLLSLAVLSDEEKALAALEPEDVIRAYFADPYSTALRPRARLLKDRCANMDDDQLFVPFGGEFPEDAEEEPIEGAVADISLRDEGENVWQVRFDSGEIRYVKLIRESEATGWKVVWCYDYY